MSYEDVIKDLNGKRNHAWSEMKRVLDGAAAAKRELSAEERAQVEKIDADIDGLAGEIDAYSKAEARNKELSGFRSEVERVAGQSTPQAPAVDYREFFKPNGSVSTLDIDLKGAQRAMEAFRAGARGDEFRAILGDSGSSAGSLTVPTEVASDIYAFMTAAVAMRRTRATIIQTSSGNPLKFPRVSTHGIATQVATQDTAFAGTDPVLADLTLNAYDYGQLLPVSADLLEDTGSNIIGWISTQLARGLGELSATAYVTGTGTNEPQGVMTAINGAGTIATGGSLVDPTFEKLIDLVYSVNGTYRARGAEWIMRDTTAAAIRKVRDGGAGTIGAFIWQPSQTVGLAGGEPDLLLGYRAYTDPNVASLASNARIIAFGDFSSYYIRDVGSVRLERSDDYLFNKNQVAFRGLLRTDGDVIDTNAINIMKRST